MSAREPGVVIISIGEIMNLCDAAGIKLAEDQPLEGEDLTTSIVLDEKAQFKYDDGSVYVGIAAYFEDVEEAGWFPLRMVGGVE